MPITVLGKSFDSEEERRSYFREALSQQLPQLREMEGFPHGTDEELLSLSDLLNEGEAHLYQPTHSLPYTSYCSTRSLGRFL